MSLRSVNALRIGVGWALVVLFSVSSFGGVVCGAESGDEEAMECCRGDMKDCNMPDKSEDCCRPDRPDENPAVLKAVSDKGAVHTILGLEIATPVTPLLSGPMAPKPARIPDARGFPDRLTDPALTIALLI